MNNGEQRPVDAAQMRADDAFVDALHGHGAPTAEASPAEAELARLLLAWRRSIDAEPFPPVVDELTLRRTRADRTRRRILTPFAAAAAAVGIALSGVALFAHDARPGDPLWGITQVVYADHARSVAAATEAQSDLELAQRSLTAGSPEAARTALERVSSALRSVSDPDVRAELSAAWESLTAKLGPGAAPSVATSLPAPPTIATVPPVTTVSVSPRPSPIPPNPAVPSSTSTPTVTPSPTPPVTSPPATSPPAPPTVVSTTATPAPTSAPLPTDPGQQAPAEVIPQATTLPDAQPTP